MKERLLALIQKLKEPQARKKAVKALAGLALLGLLFWAYGVYEKRQPSYVIDTVNEAMAQKDLGALADFFDIPSIAADFTGALLPMQKAFVRNSSEHEGLGEEALLTSVNDAITQALFALAMESAEEEEGEESEKEKAKAEAEQKAKEEAEKKPENPIMPEYTRFVMPELVPEDILPALLTQEFSLQTQKDGLAVISVPLPHSGLEEELTAKFLMERGLFGWKIVRLANAKLLLEEIADTIAQRKQEAIDNFHKANAEIERNLGLYAEPSFCKAILILSTNKQEVDAFITADLTNNGAQAIEYAAFRIEIYSAKMRHLGNLAAQFAKRLDVGASEEHTWSFEFKTDEESPPELFQDATLPCKIIPHTVRLVDGQRFGPLNPQLIDGLE